MTWFNYTHIPFYNIGWMLPTGSFKNPNFPPMEFWDSPLCSFFHPFVILVPPPSQCQTCGAVIVGGRLTRSPKHLFFRPSFYFTLKFILPAVVFSLSTLYRIFFFKPFFLLFSFQRPGLSSSPATCSLTHQRSAPDTPASPCTHTWRAQTDWNINTFSQMYTCKNSWIRNTHMAKGPAEFFPWHTCA